MSAILSPTAVVSAMHEAFNERNIDAIAAFWADDIRYVAPGIDVVGKDARLRDETIWLEAFSGNFVRVETLVSDGDQVTEFCVLGGVHTGPLVLPDGSAMPPTNRRIEGRFASHYRIAGGKVVYQQIVYDRLDLIQQLQGAS